MGKIPAYCQECKHVGHSSEVCYAAGKMERPEKRNYHMITSRQNHQGGYAEKGKKEQLPQHQKENDTGRQGKNKGQSSKKGDGSAGVGGSPTVAHKEVDSPSSVWVGPNIMGGSRNTDRGRNRECGDRGGGVDPERVVEGMELDQDDGFREVGLANHVRCLSYGGRGAAHGGRGWARGSGRFSAAGGRGTTGGRGLEASASYLSTNQFYSLMENDEYVVDGCGETDVC